MVFSCENDSSRSKSQMDPFSPIRNATDFGSIQSVSSSGRDSSLFRRPLAFAASAMTGSNEWLILMQRNPLPNKGFCGCQWCLYRAHKISFIFLWNRSSCFSESVPLPLNIFVTNLQAISTSAFILFDFYVRKPNVYLWKNEGFPLALFCSKQCASFKNVPYNSQQVYLHTVLTTSKDSSFSFQTAFWRISSTTLSSPTIFAHLQRKWKLQRLEKKTFEVTSRHQPITSAIVSKNHLLVARQRMAFC